MPDAPEIIKKRQPWLQRTNRPGKLGRCSARVGADMKKGKAAVSLCAFAEVSGLGGRINSKEPVVLSVAEKRKVVVDSTAEAGFKEMFEEGRIS